MKRKFIGFLLASVALFGILFACTSLNRLSETEFKDAIDKIDDKDGDTKELAIEIISPTNGQVITSSGFTVTGSAFSDEDVEQIFVILQPSDGDPNAVTASFSGDKIYSFSANFSAIAEGDYSLSAEVLDESGDSVSSSIISIVVALGGETNPITDISFSATPGLQEGEANAAPGATAGTLSVTGGEGTITYTLVSGTGDTDNNRFTIDGNAVKVGATALTEGSYSFRVKAECDISDYEKHFNVTVFAAGGDPITDISFSETPGLQEGEANVAPGATAGTLSVTGGEGTITYTLVSGTGDTHNNRFTIDGNAVKVGATALTEGSYSFRVKAKCDISDYVKYFNVTVSAAGGDPITDISFSETPGLQEGEANVAPGETAGTLSVTGGEGTITYTLVSGTGDTDNNRFTIDGNAVKVGATALTEGVVQSQEFLCNSKNETSLYSVFS
jgi:hypothetical protein